MDASYKTILGAFAVGLVIVGGAYFLKLQTPDVSSETSLAVVATSDAPRARIEVTDTDNDGIPDWQEALHREEPVILEEVNEAYEPETQTELFSLEFFQDMMYSQNLGAIGQEPEELVNNAVEEMKQLAVDPLYGANDVTLGEDNSETAVRAYANQMASIVLDQSIPDDSLSEAEILKQAYTLNDPSILEKLDPILAAYKNMIDRSLALRVPSKYAVEHLNIVNVYNAIYNDILAMKDGFEDPINTVVRLKRYQEDADTLYVVTLNLQKKMILEDNIVFTEADPAYRFIVQ